MAGRRRPRERPAIPSFYGNVQIPFNFFEARLDGQRVDPFDTDAEIMEMLTGTRPPASERPQDPLTAWVVLAYRGAIEQGVGRIWKPHVTREQRLEEARKILSEDEYLVLETLAIPQRYRKMPARELEELIRTAPDYQERMWAGCWLELIGWTRSPDCCFRTEYELCHAEPPVGGDLEEAIIEAYAHTIGVHSRDDTLGWYRLNTDYEANMVGWRLAVCSIHYDLNGPPPYEYVKDTIPQGPGWKQVVRLVPEKERPH